MFDFDVNLFKDIDYHIYDYIVKNADSIERMTIRELADATNVSTATIIRFCKKNNFQGFAELKKELAKELLQSKNKEIVDNDYFMDIKRFMNHFQESSIPKKIDTVADMIIQSSPILWIGIGNSGFIASYASRIFSHIDILSFPIIEPYSAVPNCVNDHGLAIVFSVSGETKEIIEFCERAKQKNYIICAITHSSNTRLARISDYIINYSTTNINRNLYCDQSSQVPPLLILELLREQVKHKMTPR